jgi:hypothetical protein
MVSKIPKADPTGKWLLVEAYGSTTISPEAEQAWCRVRQEDKAEIIAEVEHLSARPDATIKTVQIGDKRYKVQQTASGFRVVFEHGSDRNTIVSVLTPREARLVKG